MIPASLPVVISPTFVPAAETIADVRSAVAKARSTVRFDGILADPCEVRFVPAEKDTRKTACWAWLEKVPKHLIIFGECISERCLSGRLVDYYLLYWRHELQHAISTYRDLPGLNKRLVAEGVPFALLNLAEDARIENLARISDGPFGWLAHEVAPTGSTPRDILFRIIQAEADLDVAQVGLDFANPDVLGAWLRISLYYYPAFLRSPDTLSLIPLLKEWIAEFPDDKQPEDKQSGENGKPGESGDLAQGAELMADESALAQAMDDSESVDAPPDKAGPSDARTLGEVKPNEVLTAEFFEDTDLFELDAQKVARIYRILVAGIRMGPVRTATTSPTSRISIRALVRGSPRPFRTLQVENRGKPKIVWFHDCSGSMSSNDAGIEGLHILAALSTMAQNGLISAKVIFTKGDSDDKALNFCTTLPLKSKDLQRIAHDGNSECFHRAMLAHAETLRSADMVLAFTDGQISDESINQRFWQASGVFSVGLYVGNPSCTENLCKWFSSGLVRDNSENLSLALNTLIRKNL